MKRFTLISIALAFAAAPAVAGVVEVYSSSLWTDSGVDVMTGDVITVTPVAGDTWTTSSGLGTNVGPAGAPINNWDLFFSGALHSAMIAYVGSDPFQGNWGNGSFFPQATGYTGVNDGVTFTSSVNGSLWLGVNDDAVSWGTGDNYGSITANVSVGPANVVPVPGSILLGAIGLAGLRLKRQRI